MPKSRVEFWQEKLEGNVARDARQADELGAIGWEVMTLWECDIRDPAALDSFVADVKRKVKADD